MGGGLVAVLVQLSRAQDTVGSRGAGLAGLAALLGLVLGRATRARRRR
jgi:hypothetical protein